MVEKKNTMVTTVVFASTLHDASQTAPVSSVSALLLQLIHCLGNEYRAC